MQLKIPFRLARGVAVALAIVFAHYSIAWWFDHMRLRRPDFGPVVAMLLGDPASDPESSARTEVAPPRDPKQPSASLPVEVVTEAEPRH